jgi:nicotinate phosphoribosyltransferase
LLDTYDTLNAARLATEFGARLRGVRLDSGDLAELSKQVRAIFDVVGMRQTKIMASGDLDEHKITALLAAGAPFDLFGVGTELSTSRDAPALAGVYKLVELERDGQHVPKMKLSREKATYPYCKQVWREDNSANAFVSDLVVAVDEAPAAGEPLLMQVMRAGDLNAPLCRIYPQRSITRNGSLHACLRSSNRWKSRQPIRCATARNWNGVGKRYSSRLEQQEGANYANRNSTG